MRRRRGLSPRMRELTSLYAYGGSWPTAVFVSLMSRPDSPGGNVLRANLRGLRSGAPPRPTPTA